MYLPNGRYYIICWTQLTSAHGSRELSLQCDTTASVIILPKCLYNTFPSLGWKSCVRLLRKLTPWKLVIISRISKRWILYLSMSLGNFYALIANINFNWHDSFIKNCFEMPVKHASQHNQIEKFCWPVSKINSSWRPL